MVTNVSSASILCGALQIGDYIISVNNKVFRNREELFKYALTIWPNLKLIVARLKYPQSLSLSSTASQSSRSSESPQSKFQTGEQEQLSDPNSPSSKLLEQVKNVEQLKDANKFLHIEMELDYDEEALGTELENVAEGVLLVTKVTNSSFLYGVVRKGDYILNVNGKSFKNKEEFYSYCSRVLPVFKITIARRKHSMIDEKSISTVSPLSTTVILKPPKTTVSSSSSQITDSPSSSSASSTPSSGSSSPSSGTMSPSCGVQNLAQLLNATFDESPLSSTGSKIPTISQGQRLIIDKPSAIPADKKSLMDTKASPPVFNKLISEDDSKIQTKYRIFLKFFIRN